LTLSPITSSSVTHYPSPSPLPSTLSPSRQVDRLPDYVQYTNIVNSDICKIIFAIILPPLGVFLERGCGADFLINILLTILGWIPGVIHAMYVFT
jgi:uncharacterized membrane protein YqaE (UPF0057 family)